MVVTGDAHRPVRIIVWVSPVTPHRQRVKHLQNSEGKFIIWEYIEKLYKYKCQLKLRI